MASGQYVGNMLYLILKVQNMTAMLQLKKDSYLIISPEKFKIKRSKVTHVILNIHGMTHSKPLGFVRNSTLSMYLKNTGQILITVCKGL